MPVRTRVFIDFWNFQLQWNDRAGEPGGVPVRCDWRQLPVVLAEEAMAKAPALGQLRVDETRIYASVELPRESKLQGWLDSTVNRFPGFRVFTRHREVRANPVHCRACGTKIEHCPSCKAILKRAAEKGVDAAIVTDMFWLVWEQALDVAILVSSDSDLVPAVERIQDRGIKIVNATWDRYGHELAKACWASFEVNPLVGKLTRT